MLGLYSVCAIQRRNIIRSRAVLPGQCKESGSVWRAHAWSQGNILAKILALKYSKNKNATALSLTVLSSDYYRSRQKILGIFLDYFPFSIILTSFLLFFVFVQCGKKLVVSQKMYKTLRYSNGLNHESAASCPVGQTVWWMTNESLVNRFRH